MQSTERTTANQIPESYLSETGAQKSSPRQTKEEGALQHHQSCL